MAEFCLECWNKLNNTNGEGQDPPLLHLRVVATFGCLKSFIYYLRNTQEFWATTGRHYANEITNPFNSLKILLLRGRRWRRQRWQ